MPSQAKPPPPGREPGGAASKYAAKPDVSSENSHELSRMRKRRPSIAGRLHLGNKSENGVSPTSTEVSTGCDSQASVSVDVAEPNRTPVAKAARHEASLHALQVSRRRGSVSLPGRMARRSAPVAPEDPDRINERRPSVEAPTESTERISLGDAVRSHAACPPFLRVAGLTCAGVLLVRLAAYLRRISRVRRVDQYMVGITILSWLIMLVAEEIQDDIRNGISLSPFPSRFALELFNTFLTLVLVVLLWRYYRAYRQLVGTTGYDFKTNRNRLYFLTEVLVFAIHPIPGFEFGGRGWHEDWPRVEPVHTDWELPEVKPAAAPCSLE